MGMGAMTRTVGRHDADLLSSAAAGDEIAFRRIIAEYHEDVRRVCCAIAGDDGIADEAAQAAWVIAWRKLGKVRGPAQLRPWLMSVAVKEVKQLLRKRKRRAEVEVAAAATRVPGGVDPATDAAALDLHAALARLAPDDAALLALRYVAGFDSNELALATGISPSGTRSRIERLLKKLREDLSDG
jgi:RNA polymerase sigma-70 factor (ECF subfamily)